MKAFKVSMVAVSLFVSVCAKAEYQWIPLTNEQMKSVKTTCAEQSYNAKRDSAVMAGAGAILAYFATTVVQDGGGPVGVTVGAAGVTSLLAAGSAAYRGFFSTNEIQILLMEKQLKSPGLMTAKLEQIAVENNYDLTKLLAVLNLMGINNQVCTPVDGTGISRLTDVQDAEMKKAAIERAKLQAEADKLARLENEAKQEEYRIKQQELITNQLSSK